MEMRRRQIGYVNKYTYNSKKMFFFFFFKRKKDTISDILTK